MALEDGSNRETAWYAVYTKKQKEHFADIKLLQLDIETFLPLIRTRIRRKLQLRPLFPCYIFARFDLVRWLYTVNHLEGVNKVVSFNNQPIPVDPEIINELRQRVGEQGFWEAAETLAPGDKVRIHDGIFAGYEGHVECIRPRDRVVILLKAIVSRARLEVDQNFVEIIKEYTS